MRLTFPALIEPHVRERPHSVALIDGDRRVTFAEFDLLCQKTAAWLAKQGIRAGDRVAVWLVNRVEWLALFFGLARLQAVMVPVNTRYRAAELTYLLERSGARLLILQLNFKKIDFTSIIEQVEPNALPALERIALIDAGSELPKTVLGKPTLPFELSDDLRIDLPDASDPDALAILFTTSGTTKGPKLVMHPQRTISLHCRRLVSSYGFDQAGSGSLGALPFCGIFGLNSTLAPLTAGAPVAIMDVFEPGQAVALIRRHQLTHMFGSDEMYQRMLEHIEGPDPLPSMRVYGMASFHPGLPELAKRCLQHRIVLTGLYGSSEVHSLFSAQRASAPLEQRIEGGGFPTSPDAEVRIRDVETGELLQPGKMGEIEIRAPTNFVGYLNDAESTAKAMCPDGFFKTGDVGFLREDGSFVYLTRQGDAIRLAGFLVNPVEIEDVLKRYPGVVDVQVIGVSLDNQSRCVAFVIPAPGSEPNADEMIRWAKDKMAGFKVPVRVWFVDDYPKTDGPNGVKIQRNKMRQMASERLAAAPSPATPPTPSPRRGGK